MDRINNAIHDNGYNFIETDYKCLHATSYAANYYPINEDYILTKFIKVVIRYASLDARLYRHTRR